MPPCQGKRQIIFLEEAISSLQIKHLHEGRALYEHVNDRDPARTNGRQRPVELPSGSIAGKEHEQPDRDDRVIPAFWDIVTEVGASRDNIEAAGTGTAAETLNRGAARVKSADPRTTFRGGEAKIPETASEFENASGNKRQCAQLERVQPKLLRGILASELPIEEANRSALIHSQLVHSWYPMMDGGSWPVSDCRNLAQSEKSLGPASLLARYWPPSSGKWLEPLEPFP